MNAGIGAPPTYRKARLLFRRGLAVVAAVAVGSFWLQMDGLVGSQGISPAAETQSAFEAGPWGADWTWRPTLLWLASSDVMLHGLCAAGLALAALLFLDVAPALCALGLWVVYLSLCWAGGVFMNFQWDILLVEVLLLASLWLPWRLRREKREQGADGAGDPEWPAARWMLWFLLLRFMFESGVVKLTSGDPTWADRTAMSFHYMTQPLPHGLSWAAHNMPLWIHRISAQGMFFVELVMPWCVFLPWVLARIPRFKPWVVLLPRRAAFVCFVALQVAIGSTGNYGFFGLLTCVLCLPLLDDRVLRAASPSQPARAHWLRQVLSVMLCVPLLGLGTSQLLDLDPDRAASRSMVTSEHVEQGLWQTLDRHGPLAAIRLAELRAQPWLSVNAYGLFRVMTTRRPDIRIQYSDDGERWIDVDFHWQVDDVGERPGWVQPHMPRLDWQLWFEALRWEAHAYPPRPYQPSAWFGRFLEKLLAGEPSVWGLLAEAPPLGSTPHGVRATLVDDRFSTREEREIEPSIWVRQRIYPSWIRLERQLEGTDQNGTDQGAGEDLGADAQRR